MRQHGWDAYPFLFFVLQVSDYPVIREMRWINVETRTIWRQSPERPDEIELVPRDDQTIENPGKVRETQIRQRWGEFGMSRFDHAQ